MSAIVPQVIFVEDDEALRKAASQALELDGLSVAAFVSATSALETIERDFPGVVVSDVRLPGMDGIEFFERLRARDEDIPMIFTTAHGDVDMAVNAMKDGAADFFTKPYSVGRLAHSIRRAAEQRALKLENRNLKAELRVRSDDAWVGRSPASASLERITREVAQTDADLLVRGHGGSGKSHLARRIHELSGRSARPFVVVDPGIFANDEADLLLYGRDPSMGLSRSGMIERANGGSLVLEAIEQIPPKARSRLINLIDTRSFLAQGAERPRQIDVRIMGTTGGTQSAGADDLDGLLHRLSGIAIALPPLIERQDDIPDFFRLFVAEHERKLGREAGPVREADWHHLLTHDWPGNLRELRMFAQNFVLGLTRLTVPVAPVPENYASLRSMTASFEKTVLEDALMRADGNIVEVQRMLSVPRKTLYDKLSKHGIRPAEYRK